MRTHCGKEVTARCNDLGYKSATTTSTTPISAVCGVAPTLLSHDDHQFVTLRQVHIKIDFRTISPQTAAMITALGTCGQNTVSVTLRDGNNLVSTANNFNMPTPISGIALRLARAMSAQLTASCKQQRRG